MSKTQSLEKEDLSSRNVSTTEVEIHSPDSDVERKWPPGNDDTVISPQTQSEDTIAAPAETPIDLENGEGTELKRKASSVIPRSKRRGLFGQLVIGIPEIEDPLEYSPRIKGFIVFIISVAAIAAPMGYETFHFVFGVYWCVLVLMELDPRFIFLHYPMSRPLLILMQLWST